ncbi:methylmalonate-semialdehyde dehydrogenase (acylating) [Thermogemmatispora aurantia]|uniref:CoA-acylating methylmalonate-semialdehyde dehydrogenase n=1 Tax=Thermogemmatispora aurantia TaxID=2045279 RepID=UPI00124F0BF9|nr:CoA-acylating methylmalonate-semialdehyde dehydrogenase [Thermogemmatispora aurantia]GER85444.1 methylmalonate-semialdehyde dehydrogenase (acylating) [Thermogemmatispora aurantia]
MVSPITQPPVLRNYIGGSWCRADASDTLEVRNPATDEVLALVPLSNARDIEAAVASAATAFPGWRATPPQERVRYLFKLRVLLDEQREELARLITTDMGKTLDDARGEVQRGLENVETACGIPSLMMGYGLEDGAARGIDEEVIYQPLGVCAAITPFNFPFMIAFWFWPYAIACGNTFIVKPSEQDPLVQQRVFELIDQVGFPPGVINLVNGGKEAVNALLDHPQIKAISFVGSTQTAAYVYARAAAQGKRVQASGGAKNAIVVMPDADLDSHLGTIMNSCFGAAGQRCLANSLIMPVGEAHARTRLRLSEAAARLHLGNGLEPGVDMGPVVSAQARERIVAAISQGIAEGAQLALDGRHVSVPAYPHGYFVGPTILDEVRPSMRVYQEEIFGPVVSIAPVASLDEAITLINAGDYGNAASIFTDSGAAAREFRYRVEVGNVGINIGVAAPMAYFPFSGTKRSFFGTLHPQGRDAVRFFTESKVVISRWGSDGSSRVSGIGR